MQESPRKKSLKIAELIAMMDRGEFVLPEIQREFVWDMDRIAQLWDSVYRGFPIGQLLFWITSANIPTYSFADSGEEFLFVGGRPKWSHDKKVSSSNKVIVLDGQQRLTSFLLGARREGIQAKIRINSAQKSKFLCIYIGDKDVDGDNEVKLFDWKDEEESDEYISVARALYSRKQHTNIRVLKKRINSIKTAVPVDYVMGGEVMDVIEIFRRLNNNGKNMETSELFLAMWFGSGRARDLRGELSELRKAFGGDFAVKDATITQLLLTIFSEKSKMSSMVIYDEKMFRDISTNLLKLREAIKAAVSFLREDCGIYSDNEMLSHSLFIPLVHVFYHFDSQISECMRKELRCFTFRALVFGLFNRSTNTTLMRMKKTINGLVNRNDSFIAALDDNIAEEIFFDYKNHKSQWLDGEISELMKIKKGSRTNLILLLIMKEPANVSGNMYDQDHLFARDLFDKTTIKALPKDRRQKFGICVNGEILEDRVPSEADLKVWKKISREMYDTRDTLPNLWLLESSRNSKKGKKLLNIWYDEQSEADKQSFWSSALISPKYGNEILKLKSYKKFYNERENALFSKIYDLLKLPK